VALFSRQPAGTLLCLASTLPIHNHRRALRRRRFPLGAGARQHCHGYANSRSCVPAFAIIAAHAIGGRWPPGPLLINVIADTEIHIAAFAIALCPCAAPVPHTGRAAGGGGHGGARVTVGTGTA